MEGHDRIAVLPRYTTLWLNSGLRPETLKDCANVPSGSTSSDLILRTNREKAVSR